MAYYEWIVPSEAELTALVERLDEKNYPYTQENGTVIVKDNSGIEMRVVVG